MEVAVSTLGRVTVEKAVEGHRTPKRFARWGCRRQTLALWSAVALHRVGSLPNNNSTALVVSMNRQRRTFISYDLGYLTPHPNPLPFEGRGRPSAGGWQCFVAQLDLGDQGGDFFSENFHPNVTPIQILFRQDN
jgi:hypothetical protein